MAKSKTRHDYPTRVVQHVSETTAEALLREQLPNNWIVRAVTERDYGIDALIEIVGGDGRMTGNVIVAQLKGIARFTVRKRGRSYRDLSWSTYNYLLGNPAPAYLFLCSLEDRTVYWRSIREADRERCDDATSGPVIEICRGLDLSEAGQLRLQLSVMRERRWPDVERAAIASVMFFNALGPLNLACRRHPPERPLPSSVQLLIIEHYEYNRLIQRYLLADGKRYPQLPDFYDQAIARGAISEKLTFTAGFAAEFLSSFVSDFIRAIEVCDRLIRKVQRPYWLDKYPYAVMHLDAFPPYYIIDDWFPRYHFDEYENETRHINLDLFLDVDDGTRDIFRFAMISPPPMPR